MSNKIRLKRGSGSDPSASDLVVGEVALRTDNGTLFTKKDDGNIAEIGAAAGVSDGDKGDITVSNSGSTFTIDSGVVNNAKVAGAAAIAGTKISPDFGSQAITTLGGITGGGLTSTSNININNDSPSVTFNDTNSENDFRLTNSHGTFVLFDNDAGATRMSCTSAGQFTFATNVDFSSGIDVTGTVTADGISVGDDEFIQAGNNGDVRIFHSGGNNYIGGNGNHDIILQTNSTGRWRLQADGHLRPNIDSTFDIGTSSIRVRNGYFDTLYGNGSNLTALNASNISSGTVAAARLNTATTQSAGDNSTKIATTAYADTAVSNLVDSAPGTLNTLNELAAALGDDANFSTTVTNSIATKLPLAGGTITGNLVLDNATNAGRDVQWQHANDRLAFFDNTKATFGNGADLQIYHNSGFSYIDAQGDQLRIDADQLRVRSDSGESYIEADANSAVKLYFDNSNKFQTSSSGVSVTGNIAVSGTVDGRDVATDGTKLDGIESNATADQSASEILTLIKTVDGSGSGLDADTVDGIHASSFLRSDAGDSASGSIIFDATQGIRLKHGNETDTNDGFIASGRFSSGLNIVGTQTTAGTGRQVRIWGDVITNSGNKFWNAENDGSGSGLDSDTLDGVQGSSYLRSDANDTFSEVLTLSKDTTDVLNFSANSTNSNRGISFNNKTAISASATSPWLRLNNNSEFTNGVYTPLKIRADGGFHVSGTTVIDSNGSISAGRISGTVSAASNADTVDSLHASSFIRSDVEDNVTNHTEWQDNAQVRLGASADMKIYHSGSQSRIEHGGTGQLVIQGNDNDQVQIKKGSSEHGIILNNNGDVELFYNNDRVFRTQERGIRVADNSRFFENSSHNTAIIQHADIHHAIILRGRTNNNGSTITNENTTTFREYGQFKFRTGAINAPERLTIASNGNIGAPSGSNIYNASDVRLKKNVVTLDKGLDTIKSLRPVSFNWIDGFCDEEKDPLYGFIAQEVETVDTNLIQAFSEEVKIGEDQENPDQVISDTLRVNEKFIIPILVKALQELTARVETLEAG